jgi:hypothetical protein
MMKTTYKMAERPPALPPLLSVANQEDRTVMAGLTTSTASTANNSNGHGKKVPPATKVKLASKTDRQRESEETHETIARVAKKVGAPAPPTPPALPADVDTKLVALSESISKKKAQAPPPSAPTVPPTKSPLHKALKHAQFKFAQAILAGDAVAYGYVHKDKRAALLTITPDEVETWTVRWPVAERGEERGRDLALLVKLLRISTKRRQASLDRATKRVEADKAKAAVLTEAQLAAAANTDVAVVAAPVVTQLLPGGPPDHVCRALAMLDSLTAHQLDLDLLKGDKHYGNRVALLRAVLNRGRGDYKAKETGITNLVQVFYSAIGVGDGKSAAAKAKVFTDRAKEIVAAFKAAQWKAKKTEKKAKLTAWRVERSKYEVPGTVLPYVKPMTRKQRAEHDAAAREEIQARILALAVSPEQPAVPNPDTEVDLVLDELQLLEDRANHLVMMQMEKANSQGAICVYNNGSRVAAGVVPLEMLRKLRPVKTDPENGLDANTMLLEVANQLLNPSTPGVPVSPVAARHLTAVINCKELTIMANEAGKTASVAVSSSRKFAPPAAATKKSTKKATPKASKKSIAAGKERAAKSADAGTRGSYAGKAIKALVKTHDARPGTKRAKALDLMLSLKTTDELIPKLAKIGANNSFIAFAVREGIIKLV